MSWKGAQLSKSADSGSTYEGVLSTTRSGTIGVSSNALADFTGGNIFDHDSTLDIVLESGGELESYTQLQVYNGSGVFMLGAPGRWEAIKYMNATLTAPNTYTLDTFLRGRRGTGHAMALHEIGDQFIFADTRTWQRPNAGVSQIGLTRLYKGVTFHQPIASVPAQSFTNSAVGLKPYAPVKLKGVRDGGNDLTISCKRCTRTGGAWRDFVDVVLSEPLCDFEIWNSGFTTLLRTISSIDGNSTIYTAAMQTADGLTPGNPVSVRIYSISPTVGRGYKLEGTI